MKIVVYSDGYFYTNKDGSSQVGYLILMADMKNKSNLIECARKNEKV